MGAVHRAIQVPLGRAVALKVIAPWVAADAGARARFREEWRAAAAIRHPGILPIYDAGELEGVPYIAMRLITGPDLRRIIDCDVKPANILVTGSPPDEHPYLTDFGLVRAGASLRRLTESGEWVGTLDYVSPEQIQGAEIDGRADLYALGCVLFELLTVQVPFPRETDAARLWAHLSDDPPRIGDVLGVPMPAMDAVVATALAKDPARRYATAARLGAAAQAAAEVSRRRTHASAKPDAEHARRRLSTGAALAAVAVAGVAVLLARAGDSEDAERLPLPRSAGSTVGKPILVGGTVTHIVAAHGRLWVTSLGQGTLTDIDPAASAVSSRPIRLGAPPYGLAATPDAVWVGGSESGTVMRVNRRRRRVEARVRVGGVPASVAAGADAIWVGNLLGYVSRIDPRRNREVARIQVGKGITALAVQGGSLWATVAEEDALARIDMRTGRLAAPPRPIGDNPTDVVAGDGTVWLTARDDDDAVRVDPRSGRATMRVRVPRDPYDVAIGADSIWVTSWARDTLTRIDPATGAVIGRPIRVGDSPRDVIVAAGAVWVANSVDGTVTRVQPGS